MTEGYVVCPGCGEERLPIIRGNENAVACGECGVIIERAGVEALMNEQRESKESS